jgi:group I intron endonuclease
MELYLVTNILDGTMYVGKTAGTIKRRWQGHLTNARCGSTTHLHNAIRKYGAENFTIEPLTLLDQDFTDEQGLNEGERLMIRLLRVNCRLYNLTDGGEGVSGWTPSQETRRKISDANRGRKHSEEEKARMSAAPRPPRTAEHRQKISQNNRSRSPELLARITLAVQRAHTGKSHQASQVLKQALAVHSIARLTHCRRGHEMTPENTRLVIRQAKLVGTVTQRVCKLCDCMRSRAYRAQKTQHAAETQAKAFVQELQGEKAA